MKMKTKYFMKKKEKKDIVGTWLKKLDCGRLI